MVAGEQWIGRDDGYRRDVQLTPQYDGPPVLELEGPVSDPTVPLLRQRRRLADVLQGFDDAQWSTPSRCDGWSVRDVVSHLVDTNGFWALSIGAARAGNPTRMLAEFDPVATPAMLVDAGRGSSPDDVLRRFVESTDALADAVAGLDDDAWATRAESPLGHAPLESVLLHALWDSWIHERDVLLPLGIEPVEEDDEVVASLRYAAAIGPALSATRRSQRSGALMVEATEPDVRFVVEVSPTSVVVRPGEAPASAARLAGRAVDLVEGLTYRAPLAHDLGSDDRWLLQGLDEVFDVAG